MWVGGWLLLWLGLAGEEVDEGVPWDELDEVDMRGAGEGGEVVEGEGG